jgi:rfaE bifunctional protein nucleotidyltransferase chain/domain
MPKKAAARRVAAPAIPAPDVPSSGIARAKIHEIAALAERARALRESGRRVVLAHGTFDLLHMGHVRHLEEARRQGDALFVTVTDDAYVNKGPGRPVFTAALRAEMLGALAYVDGVAISRAPTAENVIAAIRPDVYVKGSDYAQAEDDVTGKIVDERRAVERHGGRIHFTDDIVFSSSSLLNRHFDVHDPALRAYLDRMRERDALGPLLDLLESVRDRRVLLVGDAIVDEYQYVSPLGKSPKENLIATLYQEREEFAGGVIAAANHVAGFCREVEVLTMLGAEDGHEDLVRRSLKPNVRLDAVTRPGAPTTRKCRFVDRDYFRKLFEVYFMDDAPIAGALEAEFAGRVARRAREFDVVIVTDFGHGLVTPASVEALTREARFLAVNAQSNSANHGFNLITKYPRADYVCIDAPEAKLAVHDKYSELERVAADLLPARVRCDRMILTHGRNGCVTWDRKAGARRIPAFTGRALDTMGAGDAFLAVTSPLVATGADLELVGFIGNAVGAMKVGIVGHRQSVEKVPLMKYLQTLLK